jgi:hypothetical protein
LRTATLWLGALAGLLALADSLVRPRRSPLAFFGGLKGVAIVAAIMTSLAYLAFQCHDELKEWGYVVALGRPATGRASCSAPPTPLTATPRCSTWPWWVGCARSRPHGSLVRRAATAASLPAP